MFSVIDDFINERLIGSYSRWWLFVLCCIIEREEPVFEQGSPDLGP